MKFEISAAGFHFSLAGLPCSLARSLSPPHPLPLLHPSLPISVHILTRLSLSLSFPPFIFNLEEITYQKLFDEDNSLMNIERVFKGKGKNIGALPFPMRN